MFGIHLVLSCQAKATVPQRGRTSQGVQMDPETRSPLDFGVQNQTHGLLSVTAFCSCLCSSFQNSQSFSWRSKCENRGSGRGSRQMMPSTFKKSSLRHGGCVWDLICAWTQGHTTAVDPHPKDEDKAPQELAAAWFFAWNSLPILK